MGVAGTRPATRFGVRVPLREADTGCGFRTTALMATVLDYDAAATPRLFHVGAGVGLREAVRPTVWRLGSVVRDGQCQAMPCGVHVGASQSGPANDQIL